VGATPYHLINNLIRLFGQDVGQRLAKEAQSLPDDDAVLQKSPTPDFKKKQ
jgi:hypothetical protein